jgi:hypothetical protein
LGLDTLFIDNEYLDLYCSLILERGQSQSVKGLTERHHIIQRAYYKQNNLPVNNTKRNLAILTHHDHCLAHYYLCLCTKTPYTYLNEHAFIKMVKIKTRFEFDFEQFLREATKYNEIYTDFVLQQSTRAKLRLTKTKAGTAGKHCYTDGIKYFYAYECPEGCWPESPQKGKKVSEETKAKMSEAAKQRYANPAARERFSKSKLGSKGTVIGKIWINNGEQECYIAYTEELPDGWSRGRCPVSVAKNKQSWALGREKYKQSKIQNT